MVYMVYDYNNIYRYKYRNTYEVVTIFYQLR